MEDADVPTCEFGLKYCAIDMLEAPPCEDGLENWDKGRDEDEPGQSSARGALET